MHTSGSLRSYLKEICEQIFSAMNLDKRFGEVFESQRPDLGQFQCNGAMSAAKEAKKNPRLVAQEFIDKLKESHPELTLSMAGPGFVNISVSDEFLAEFANGLHADKRCGAPENSSPHKVIIDFAGPNLAKPMHVGHLRTSVIGDCLTRIFRFCGDAVTSDNHLGDFGTQMGMLISELARLHPELPYFDESFSGPYPTTPPCTINDLEEMYPAVSARCKSDPEQLAQALAATVEFQLGRLGYIAICKHITDLSVEELKKDFALLNISFDTWLGESHYKHRIGPMIESLRKTGLAVESQGAIVFPLPQEPDRETPPLLLVKKDGGYLYGTSDLATIEERVSEFGARTILYVVDKRQSLHFEQLFAAARLSGISKHTGLEHIKFGMVNGPDGRPFKTRDGGVMRLRTLIDEVINRARDRMNEAGIAKDYPQDEQKIIAFVVGIAALKFADLSNNRESDYIFDLDKFTSFEGKTGPFILYSAVRIKSILRKAAEQNRTPGAILAPTGTDRQLLLTLTRLPDVVTSAWRDRMPSYLCEFIFDLAQSFNRFYAECHILKEPDPARAASWLALCELCLAEFELILTLLGIDIPDRM